LGIAAEAFKNNDLHIHVPEGAIPKDGPSAGITMATAIASVLTRIPIHRDVAMTGEVTLRGKVLPIGGVKEKLLAAHRIGLRTIVLPKDNEKDLAEVPQDVLHEMQVHLASSMDDVLQIALERVPVLRPEIIEQDLAPPVWQTPAALVTTTIEGTIAS
jgi:ATP-dependent Lon protease